MLKLQNWTPYRTGTTAIGIVPSNSRSGTLQTVARRKIKLSGMASAWKNDLGAGSLCYDIVYNVTARTETAATDVS